MSTYTQLLCNRFGGIRERNASFSEELITAQDLQNVELYHTGINGGVGIRTVKGNVSIANIDTSSKIIKIFESIQKQKRYCLVYSENKSSGKLSLFDPEKRTFSTIKDNLNVAGKANGFDVSQGWSDLFFFTNGKNMFTVEINEENNSTTSKVVDFAPKDTENNNVKGIIAAVWNNRLWIANENVIWYSVMSDIYDFSTHDSATVTSAGFINLLKPITAIHEYLGSLAVFFSDSSVLISESNGYFSVAEESPGGCAGYGSLVFHDTDLFFYDDTKKSVFSFKQVINGEKTLGENVAIEIQSILNDINSEKLDEIQAYSVFIKEKNEIWWILPGNTEYSVILIYDYLKGAWIKRKSQKINSISIINGILYSAGNCGDILEEYTSDLFNGKYIEHFYKCSPCNLGADNTLKVLAFPPRVTLDMPYLNQFFVKYVKNYNTLKTPKIKFIKSKIKNFLIWGSGIWGKDYWLDTKVNLISKFPSVTFKTLEITVYTTAERQSFSIKKIEFSKIKVKQV